MTKYQKLHKEELILLCANYCIQYKWSIREIARNIGIGKTTVYRWLTEDLMYMDSQTYNQCKKILEKRRVA